MNVRGAKSYQDSSTPMVKGNIAFRAGKWHEAIGHYSAAIFADRSNSTYPLNRAAAYLKVGKNEDAERDCTTTLQLEKTNVKALFRRAQARAALGKNMEAQLDLAEALRIDPSNAAVKADLERIRKSNSTSTSPSSNSHGKPSSVRVYCIYSSNAFDLNSRSRTSLVDAVSRL
ncbi:TPR-like protein, partial [Clavulina sp. PMI_390]